jgi:lipoprotein-anchoring transpeptidase ErfK/SrfK
LEQGRSEHHMSAPPVDRARRVPLRTRPSTGARRPLLGVAAVIAGLLVAMGGAVYLYDHSRRGVIADGVRIDGVSVGGMGQAAARAKVQRELAARLNGTVTVHSGSHTWTLRAREAAIAVGVNQMVAEAVSASREGSIVTRAARELFGGTVNRDIPLAVSYSHGAVRGLAYRVRAAVNRPPRDATVSASASGLTVVPDRPGIRVDTVALEHRLTQALTGAGTSNAVAVPIRAIRPAITTAKVAARYPAYIVINRGQFRLSFYEHLRLSKTYEIAVGMQGLETPAGLYHVQWEQVDPPWYVPNKAWAGALAGTVVPPGPSDPLKARFMSFDGGAGIHGIDPSEYGSIGHYASHGCVRMRIPDVIALYSRTPVGTPVYII